MTALVGRVHELSELVAAFEGLTTRRSSWVEVTGEPGIGKSRLIAELCRIAEEKGALVLSGRGAELERDVPFGVVIDALDDYVGALDDTELDALCGHRRAALRALLPSLTERAGRASRRETSEDQRYPTYRAVRRLCERLGRSRPLVLVLDDLHWADSASLELVSFLVRHPPDACVLTVLAWQPGRAPPLVGALSSGAREPPRSALRLGGLSRDQIDELLGGTLDDARLSAVHRASGGNPFCALALAASRSPGVRRHRGAQEASQWETDATVPRLVADAVRQEVASLSPGARLVAQGAAVAGEPFDVDLAACCAGEGVEDAPACIDELVGAGILRSTPSPSRFAFRHPIVRRAVYDSAGPAWRAAAHRRAADALAARAAPLTALAHHVARCASDVDADAAELLLAAAAEVVGRAPASAAAWLDAALDALPGNPASALRLELLGARADVARLLGELEIAHGILVTMLELLPAGDDRRLRTAVSCAGVEHGLGRFADARSLLADALDEHRGGESTAHAELYLELAVSSLYTLDFPEAATFAALATKSASGGDALIAGTSAALLAFSSASTEEPAGYAAARAACNDAAAILDGLDDDTVARRLDAPYHLAWAERLVERYDAAAAHLERAVKVADAGGGSQWLLPAIVEQAKALLACGHVARARKASEEAVAEARASGIGLVLLLAQTAHVAVLSACGDAPAALQAGAAALDVGREMEAYHVANARRQLALARLDGGDPVGFLEETAATEDEDAVTDGLRARILEGRVRAALACGRPEVATAAAARLERLAMAVDLPATRGYADRAGARLAAATSPASALAKAQRAVARFEEAGAGLEALRTAVMASELLGACGRSEEALAACRRALDALDAEGAHGYAQ